MKISIASDHGGFDLKEDLRQWLAGLGHEVVDFGCQGHDSCDYADFCEPAARAVLSGVTTVSARPFIPISTDMVDPSIPLMETSIYVSRLLCNP